MPTKQKSKGDRTIAKRFPGFEIAKQSNEDSAQFLPPDSRTPAVAKLHKKYRSDSVEEKVLAAAKAKKGPSATKAVVLVPKQRGERDTAVKRLTVLMKQGKIGAIQG